MIPNVCLHGFSNGNVGKLEVNCLRQCFSYKIFSGEHYKDLLVLLISCFAPLPPFQFTISYSVGNMVIQFHYDGEWL